MADVLVLGAGMVGVSTALALQAAGRDVVLADRRGPGEETSYGNAGVIQAEAVEPYPMPLEISQLLRIALRQSNDVNYHLDAMPSQLRPLWQYFLSSRPSRHQAISQVYAGLSRRATADHAPLIAASGADNLIRRNGMRVVHRSVAGFDLAARQAEKTAARYGVELRIEPAAELARAEPSLKAGLPGAIHWPESWSCMDPGGLTRAYATLFVSRGGSIVVADAATLQQQQGGWAISAADGPVAAKHVVVALGPWSPILLKRFGYDIPMLRKRGYHRHFSGGGTLNAPVYDADNATVLSPMLRGIRVLTGAELARFDAPQTPVQMQRSVLAADELVGLGEPMEQDAWFGNRPCMPDMLSLVGAAPRHGGLWFHFGHGHQGFTHGPTTAALLAEDITTGRSPVPELRPARLRSL